MRPRIPTPTQRQVQWMGLVLIVAFLASFLWLVFRVVSLNNFAIEGEQRYAIAKKDRSDLHDMVDNQQVALDKANQMLIDLGREPVLIPGEPGAPGATGAAGPRGYTGRAGADGLDGIDGLDGLDGVDGADGTDGAPGATGATGDRGPQGEQGPPGPAGPAGADGTTPDLSAYATQSWVLSLIQALGCDVTVADTPTVFTCTLTGKP